MKNPRTWNYAGLILAIVIPFFALFVGVLPAIQGAQAIDQTREAVVIDNEARAALLRQYTIDSRLNKEKIALDLADLIARVPTSLNAVEFVDELRALSASTGATVSQFSAANPIAYVAPANLAATPALAEALSMFPRSGVFVSNVTLSLTGTVDQITAFVDGIRNGTRCALIYSLVIPNQIPDKAGRVTADISAQVFVLRPTG